MRASPALVHFIRLGGVLHVGPCWTMGEAYSGPMTTLKCTKHKKYDNHGRELLIYCCLRYSGGFCSPQWEIKVVCKGKVKQLLTVTAWSLKLWRIKWMLTSGGGGGRSGGEFSHRLLPTTLHHSLQRDQVNNIDWCIDLIRALIVRNYEEEKPRERINPKDSLSESSGWNTLKSGCLLQAPVRWALFSLPLSFTPSFARWPSCCYGLTEKTVKEIWKPTERKILLLSLYPFRGTTPWALSFIS